MIRKIIIIGSGVAGLSAGIYAQQQGFETIIYERHTQTGGLCTGWERKGFHIDGCIHWMTGTKEGSDLRKIWDNVGALEYPDGSKVNVFLKDYFDVYEIDGKSVYLWRDIKKLEKGFLEIAPEDKRAVKSFIKNLKAIQKMIVPSKVPVNMMNLKELLVQLWSMRGMLKALLLYGGVSCQSYARRFKSPQLRTLFRTCMPKNYSVAAFMFTLSTFTKGNGGIPEGGSLKMAQRMTDKYISLGGVVKTGMLVTHITTENNRAISIEGITKDGSEFSDTADYIISAADAYQTRSILLHNRFADKKFDKRYHNPKIYETQSCVMMFFGVDDPMTDYPYSLVFQTEPYRVGCSTYDDLSMATYFYEKSFAEPGKSIIHVLISQGDADYEYWKSIHSNRTMYKAEKNRLTELVEERLVKRFPELKGKMTLLDCVTPVTFEEYCGSYHGAWMAFHIGKGTKNLMHTGKIPGLDNCYLTGQWLQPPGGLPVAVTMGKFTIQRICKKERMNWKF